MEQGSIDINAKEEGGNIMGNNTPENRLGLREYVLGVQHLLSMFGSKEQD